MKRIICGCFLLVCASFAGALYAERAAAPVDYYDFDGWMTGAKALGMGNSAVAVRNVAESAYWNPAGLNLLESNVFTICLDLLRTSRIKTDKIMDGESLRGRKLSFLSLAGHNGAISFRPLVNKYDEVTLDSDDPENNKETKEIKVNSFMLSLAQQAQYAAGTTSIGMNLSYLNGSLAVTRICEGETFVADISDGNGFSIDWGTAIKMGENLMIGLVVQNIPGYIYWEDYKKTQLPVFLRAGFSLGLPGVVTISTEYEKRFYRDTDNKPKFLHVGMEQWLSPLICLRGGVYGEDLNEADTRNYTAGLGLNQDGYAVDLAFRKYRQIDEGVLEDIYQYVMSLGIPFGNKKSKL